MKRDELVSRAHRIPDEVLTQGDLAVLDELMSPDLKNSSPRPGLTAAEGFKLYVCALRGAFPDLHCTVEDEVVEGETVVLRTAVAGTHRGACFGIPPTGKVVRWAGVHIVRVGPDGRFIEHCAFADALALLGQLGTPPLVPDARDRQGAEIDVVRAGAYGEPQSEGRSQGQVVKEQVQ